MHKVNARFSAIVRNCEAFHEAAARIALAIFPTDDEDHAQMAQTPAALPAALAFRGGHMLPPALAADHTNARAFAVCGVTGIIDDMMETDRYRPDRLEYEQEVREELMGDLTSQMQALEQQVQSVEPGSEDFNRLREQYFRLQGEATRRQQEVRRRVEVKVVEQLVDCRMIVLASTRAVADDLGFEFVLSSESTEKEYEQENVRDLVLDFLSRPVVVYPEAGLHRSLRLPE